MFVELMPLLAGRTVLITVAKVNDPASRDCSSRIPGTIPAQFAVAAGPGYTLMRRGHSGLMKTLHEATEGGPNEANADICIFFLGNRC